MSLPTPSKVFIFATGADTAGCAVRVAQAFQHKAKKNPAASWAWDVHSMVSMINYIDYPIDLPYSRADLQSCYDKADLVQMNSTTHGHDWYDRGQGKPTVLMHHGFHFGHFDRDIYGCVAEATRIGATQVGSTVNLELLAPFGPPGPDSVTWTPTPYDLVALVAMRRKLYSPNGKIVRIGHAPTDRTVKSTDSVILAVKSLQERGLPVELVLIEHKTWAETMYLKAKYVDVLVDQLHLGYGCNAIEAWALGIPVIGGVDEHPDWRAHMYNRFGLVESETGLPFSEATERSLEQALENFVRSRDLREYWAGVGKAHVERHHSEQAVVALLSSIFSEAVLRPTTPGPTATKLTGTQDQRLEQLRRIRAQQRLQAAETAQIRARMASVTNKEG